MKKCYIPTLFILLIFSFIFADPPNWDADGDGVLDNFNDYQNNGSITSIALQGEENAGSSGDMLAAFVDDEQRGVAQATPIPFGPYAGQYSFLMLIYSNEASGETVTFKFYNSENDQIYDI